MKLQLILTVFMTCFGSSFVFGYYIGILNNPGNHFKEFLRRNGQKAQLDVLLATNNAVFIVFSVIAAFCSSWPSNHLGRRNGLLANHTFAIIGSVLVGPSVKANSIALFYLGRCFSGLNAGFTMGIASLYLTEIAPRKYRGAIGACHQLAITLGIFFSFLMTMGWSLNSYDKWTIAYALGGVPSVISLIVLPLSPKSPRYLFLNCNKPEKARTAFLKFNDTDDVDKFFIELQDEVEKAKDQPEFKFVQLFTQPDLRMPVMIACMVQIMQQLSGINAVMFYSGMMFESAGINKKNSELMTLLVGAINVISTIIALPLLERLGRRILLIWPSLMLIVSQALLVVFVNLAQHDVQYTGIFAAIATFLFIICFAVGLGPIPGLIVSEIFRTGPRASAYSLSQGIQCLANLVVTMIFPTMNKGIKGFSFLPFMGVTVLCWAFFFLYMPETKNKSFDETATKLASSKMVFFNKKTPKKAVDSPKQKDNQQEKQQENQQEIAENPNDATIKQAA